MPLNTQDPSAEKTDRSSAFRLSDYHYNLPSALIAQSPLESRSDSRLLVCDGRSTLHRHVHQLPQLLKAGDHLVFNDTRVIPARLMGRKHSGGKLEMMLERIAANGNVLAKIRSSKSPKPGSIILLYPRLLNSQIEPQSSTAYQALVVGRQDDLFELTAAEGGNDEFALFIEQHGEIPLPPYIERKPDDDDLLRYQTVFADKSGAVAAPTAGLHFDDALFDALQAAGITHSFITLHVGAGTFQPVRVENPIDHVMHAERVSVNIDTVKAVEETQVRGGRVIAVGTTSVRALESAAKASGKLEVYQGETRLFLTPGASFNVVDGIFTNFHLPESTLLMLISAFAGLDTTLAAYRAAVEERYRFFSYGDAMLVWPQSGVRA